MSNDKRPAGLGFEDELDSLDLKNWSPGHGGTQKREVDTQTVRAVAEKEGFSSREPQVPQRTPKPVTKPEKERTDQINFRAKISTIEAFKAICESQEPKWPHGYTLERAVKALKRELEGEG